MFENMTDEFIWRRMMQKVPTSRDKREGSIIYDATVPAALELMLLYAMLDWYIKQSFGDTAEREYLVRLALERGLSPYPATYATIKGVFKPSTINVTGKRFSVGTMDYKVISEFEKGIYFLECETAGRGGNVYTGQLIPIEYIEGLESANILELTVPGEDDEETEVFRERYLNSLKVAAYGGNIADYKEKVRKIPGVGGVKVHPIHNGGGTVRVVFSNSEHDPPTEDFVKKVQEMIDPIPFKQQGVGIAPIGHWATVDGCVNSQIRIDLKITFSEGISYRDLKNEIERTIDDYFYSLNEKWENGQVVTLDEFSDSGIVIRISHIESRILELPQILDIQDTKLNGIAGNLTLGTDELAVRGVVNG